MIRAFLELAVRNIVHRKRRSWLTIIGIFIGIAAVVALISLGQGLQNSVESEFEQIGSDKIFVNPGGNQMSGQASSLKLTEDDLNAVRSTRSVDRAAGTVFSTTTSEYKGEQGFVTVLGMPTDDTQELVKSSWAITIDEGRDIRSTDTSNIVIGSQVADGVFEEEIGIRSQITVNGEDFRVVGVMEPTGDPSIDQTVVMPLDRSREVVNREDGGYDWVFADVQPGFSVEDAKEDVERSLRRSRDVEEGEEDFTVSTQEDLLDSFNNILQIVQGVVIGIASISLLVGGVGIMNTMFTSITERTREIGVMKAVGATNRQVMLLFLIESGMIGLIGGIIGIIIGVMMSVGASYAATQAVNIQINAFLGLELIFGALAFSFIIGMVSGVLPARRAANLQPADALRYE